VALETSTAEKVGFSMTMLKVRKFAGVNEILNAWIFNPTKIIDFGQFRPVV